MTDFSYGSNWYKWDLHVHTLSSYDYDYRGEDADELLVKAWKEHKISAIVITDHFTIDADRIIKLRKLAVGITVLPGFEMRTDKAAPNLHIIGIFSETMDLKTLSDDFNAILIRDKISKGETNENLYRHFEDIVKFTKERNGLLSIHAGSKSNGVDDQITNSLEVAQAIKTEIAESIDIFEIGKIKDITDYKEKVFKHIKEKPLVICSDNHDPREYNIKEYLWIKSSPTFEGLKQIIYEPSERISVEHNYPYLSRINCLNSLFLSNAYWFPKNQIVLNKGLVTIIGARGSGKTALLDLIALGLNSYKESSASFIKKAKKNIKIFEINIVHSEYGEFKTEYPIISNYEEQEKAKYLSQQFIENLCSDEGSKKALVDEIERFVFDALPIHEKYENDNFQELREYLCSTSEQNIENLKNDIIVCSNEIVRIVQLKDTVKSKRSKHDEMKKEIEQLKKKMPSLKTEEKQIIVGKIAELDTEINKISAEITKLNTSKEELRKIKEKLLHINETLKNDSYQILKELDSYKLTENQKTLFRISFSEESINFVKNKIDAPRVQK